MRPSLRATALLVALGLLAGGVEAQERAPGWIGVSFDVSTDRRGRTRVEVTDVVPGSPAEGAGVRAGDRLLAVNDLDRPSELRELTSRLQLRSGDRVRMIVERDGRRREIRLRAAERPGDFVASRELRWTFEPDSMVDAMVAAMDSLRVRLVQERGEVRTRVRVRTERPDAPPGVAVASGRPGASVQAPFEFFVFRGEAHDSLRREMEEVNRLVARVERRIASREQELSRAGGSVTRARRERDTELTRLRRELDEAARRSAELREAMADAARETAGFEYSVAPPPPPTGQRRVARAPSSEFRPLTPYLLGRNRVAGAEVIDLRPELAAYFPGVESGVLVVDVADRTPAAISGIVPGDVITRMDRVAVRSVDDLRFGVSQAGDTLPLTIVRRGTRLQVLLRR